MNVIGFSSNNSQNKIDTNVFAQKPCLRTNYIESNIGEDLDLRNQFKIKSLPDPINIRDGCSKNYVDSLSNNSSISKNTILIDLKDEDIANVRFIQVNQLPQVDSHLIAKLSADNAIDESSLVRNNQDHKFDYYTLTNIIIMTLKTQAVFDNEVITKAYVDQLYQENERSRRELGLDFFDESSDWVRNNQDSNLSDKKNN